MEKERGTVKKDNEKEKGEINEGIKKKKGEYKNEQHSLQGGKCVICHSRPYSFIAPWPVYCPSRSAEDARMEMGNGVRHTKEMFVLAAQQHHTLAY